MSTLESRLRLAFDPNVHTQAALARAARVKPPSVSGWLSGTTRTLKAEPLVRAAAYLGVNALWLATGEGPMRNTTGVQEPAAPYTMPWPFALVSERTVRGMSRDDLARLEGAMLVTLAAMGVSINHSNHCPMNALADQVFYAQFILAAMAVALVLLLAWVLLPFLVWLQLRRMKKLNAQQERIIELLHAHVGSRPSANGTPPE